MLLLSHGLGLLLVLAWIFEWGKNEPSLPPMALVMMSAVYAGAMVLGGWLILAFANIGCWLVNRRYDPSEYFARRAFATTKLESLPGGACLKGEVFASIGRTDT